VHKLQSFSWQIDTKLYITFDFISRKFFGWVLDRQVIPMVGTYAVILEALESLGEELIL
jgi:hypothetical protein